MCDAFYEVGSGTLCGCTVRRRFGLRPADAQPLRAEHRPGGGEEGGGGGSGSAKPLAILEVTEESTKLIPVIDVTRIVVASLTFAAVTTYLITKFLSKR